MTNFSWDDVQSGDMIQFTDLGVSPPRQTHFLILGTDHKMYRIHALDSRGRSDWLMWNLDVLNNLRESYIVELLRGDGCQSSSVANSGNTDGILQARPGQVKSSC